MRRFFLALAVATALPLGATPTPAGAQADNVGDRLILTPASADTLFRVEGHRSGPGSCPRKEPAPLRASYRGRLEVVRQSDGTLRLINSLSFPDYLAGLAEVPLSWPEEALKAQVIAARSYAFDALRRGARRAASRGYDICASDQCQVFRGASVARGAFGERWLDAVADTRGKVLLYKGRVIQAFYFSTSTGRTERAFPGGTTRPYYPSVDGEDDDAPLARWTARITFADLGAVLRDAGYTRATPVRSVAPTSGGVRITGARGSVTLTKKELRATLNKRAPCLFPARYPTKGSATGGKLPQTVPSSTYSASVTDSVLRLTGRGWGHGVGMSQWGARSLAERGRTASQILSHYYGPARVGTVTEPERIRVLAAEDLERVVVTVDGKADITTATGSKLAPGRTFEAVSGPTMRVRRAKEGRFTPVLEVSAGVVAPVREGGTAHVSFSITRPARVTVEVEEADGTRTATTPEESYETGEYEVEIPMGAAGEYRAVVVGFDGLDHVRSAPVEILVQAAAVQAKEPVKADDPFPWLLVSAAAATALAMLLALAFVVRSRRRASASAE